MNKLIIAIPFKNGCRRPPIGKFTAVHKHGMHLWEGREYDPQNPKDMVDFNAIVDKALAFFPELLPRPSVRIVKGEPIALYTPIVEEPTFPSHLQTPIKPRKRHARTKPGFVPSLTP